VLEAGLEARPGHVAASVARARCLLALDRPLDAWAALEPVLTRDPTHLVAAKLAVEVWLRVGDRQRARESLARYSPLGAADPDLVHLAARMAELEAAASANAVRAEAQGVAAAVAPSAAPAPAAAAANAADADELVTVTLGNLYLLQGHRSEAERIFRRLLRADPNNAAARQALARVIASAGGRQEI
ncbi:MAG TPA: tetratricopeptide repeat protein, partial [Thermoanaerobaculia bacterium]|nr:tetratricopeptide repeat protein [Thermoanaerobaculia bacterium]